MELKNAVAVCLIALFSATIVVLIARALDSQAASQLEPQLTAIAEELRAIRKQGGIGAPAGDATVVEGANNGLVVYYLHGSYRCPTCRTVEAEAKKIVETEFASQVERGEIAFKALDYEKPAGAELARQFKVNSSVVVLVTMKDGKIDQHEVEAARQGLAVGSQRRDGAGRLPSRRNQGDAVRPRQHRPVRR